MTNRRDSITLIKIFSPWFSYPEIYICIQQYSFAVCRKTYTLRTSTKVRPSGYHLTHLFKHDPHSFHCGVLQSYLAVNVQRPVQDFSHFICVDNGVMFSQVSVQFLNLVLQILNFYLEGLSTHTHTQKEKEWHTDQQRFGKWIDASWSEIQYALNSVMFPKEVMIVSFLGLLQGSDMTWHNIIGRTVALTWSQISFSTPPYSAMGGLLFMYWLFHPIIIMFIWWNLMWICREFTIASTSHHRFQNPLTL